MREVVPRAPIGRGVDLPRMPQVAVIAKTDHLQPLFEIQGTLEPGEAHIGGRLGFRVPALMAPDVAVGRFLPSIAESAVAGRKDLQVAVRIFPDKRFGQVAVLGFGKDRASRRSEALPFTPTDIRPDLPDMPARSVASHHK